MNTPAAGSLQPISQTAATQQRRIPDRLIVSIVSTATRQELIGWLIRHGMLIPDGTKTATLRDFMLTVAHLQKLDEG